MLLLQNFYLVDLIDQHLRFKISSIGAPLKSTLEADADLVEWTLKVSMSTPYFLRAFF